MPSFHVALTPAERSTLETVRRTLGARSHAEVVRHWIALAAEKPKEPK